MRKPGSSKRARRALRGGSRGMTLIEVVVALALLGIIAVTFLGGLTAAARAALLADVRTTAESLARAQMEYVKSQGYNCTGEGTAVGFYEKLKPKVDDGPVPDGYTIWSLNRTTGVPDNGDTNDWIIAVAWNSTAGSYADTDTDLQKITLVIKHENKAIFTLEGYKMNR